MKKHILLIATAILLISFTAKTQEKWSMEFRPGLNFPTSDSGNIDSKVGYGFELIGAYKLMPHLAVYAGWGLNQFKGDDRLLKENFTFEETGFTFGFQIIRPIGTSAFSYLAKAGAVYNHIQLENNSNTINADSGYGFGWQAALGVDYEFASNLSFRPEIRYRSLSRDAEIANVETELKLNYISFGIGLAWEF
ncbi:outer membrane beta-barrel protein [Aequorivita sublithincola]|nr:outer membrane beta-barrel protein [Aequorivita sublithincola]